MVIWTFSCNRLHLQREFLQSVVTDYICSDNLDFPLQQIAFAVIINTVGGNGKSLLRNFLQSVVTDSICNDIFFSTMKPKVQNSAKNEVKYIGSSKFLK